MQYCPCGTNKPYRDCCGVFISHQKNPSTPEELMRSRYTAYTQADMDYIAHTMKSPAADNFDAEVAGAWAKKVNWIRLKVVNTTQDFTKGVVEFFAYYSVDDKENILHEISEFNFENGKWYYVNGTQP